MVGTVEDRMEGVNQVLIYGLTGSVLLSFSESSSLGSFLNRLLVTQNRLRAWIWDEWILHNCI